jgi:hypothetical protein
VSDEPKKGHPKATDAGLRLTDTRQTCLLSQDEKLLSVKRLLASLQRLSVGVIASVAQAEGKIQLLNVV